MNYDELKNGLNTLNKEARIDELEKLRKSMDDCCLYSANGNSPETTFLITKDLMISLVDKRISELKGDKE